MGNGLRLRLSRNDGHKLKNKKENHIMKNRKNILTYIVTALSILVTSASSSQAAAAKTYNGTFTGGTFYCGGDQVVGPVVTGNWNVIIDPKTPAQVTLNVFYNGGHHLAFGYNALMLVAYADGVYLFTGLGDAATATLDTNATPATFSWDVELFGVSCPDQYPYNSLTYFGLASRGGG
jgi:hypothetical protein